MHIIYNIIDFIFFSFLVLYSPLKKGMLLGKFLKCLMLIYLIIILRHWVSIGEDGRGWALARGCKVMYCKSCKVNKCKKKKKKKKEKKRKIL